MKIFTQEELRLKSKYELGRLRDSIMTSDAPQELRDRNLDEVNIALNGGVKYTNQEALELIKAVEPDLSDMEGY